MDTVPGQQSPSSLKIERVGFAGTLRGFIAGIVGSGLWVGLMMLYLSAMAGAPTPSTAVMMLIVLLAASVTALPCMLSQMIRGKWVIEETGVHEKIVPLVSFLPLGLNRERLVRWQDIKSYGVREVAVRGQSAGRRSSRKMLYYFRAVVVGQPNIDIARKDKKQDDDFDGFTNEFSRRMNQSAG